MRKSPKISVKPDATTNSSAAKVSPFRSWKSDIASMLGPERLLRAVPVEDLLAGPEHDVALAPDTRDHLPKVFEAVRRAHDVGVDNQSHDAGAVAGILMKLLELVDGAVAVFRRLVMLDQHHGDVV